MRCDIKMNFGGYSRSELRRDEPQCYLIPTIAAQHLIWYLRWQQHPVQEIGGTIELVRETSRALLSGLRCIIFQLLLLILQLLFLVF
jgi:hypothetical protein